MRGKARGAQARWSAELQGPRDGSTGHSKSNASCRHQIEHGLIKTLLLTGGWLLTKIIAALWSISTWNVSDVTAFTGRLLMCQAISTSVSSRQEQHLHFPSVRPTDTPWGGGRGSESWGREPRAWKPDAGERACEGWGDFPPHYLPRGFEEIPPPWDVWLLLKKLFCSSFGDISRGSKTMSAASWLNRNLGTTISGHSDNQEYKATRV